MPYRWRIRAQSRNHRTRNDRADSGTVMTRRQLSSREIDAGSVSTLAPLFAAALPRTIRGRHSWSGSRRRSAPISMAFAEALSDDGSLTGRGAPVVRGIVCGGMTALGGLGHALPYLIPHFYVATSVAFAVVAVELAVISWIRTRYMDTPFLQAAFQVIVGGVLVFVVGILIGSS